MDGLPFIDEHRQRCGASPAATWAALLAVLARGLGGRVPLARLLGCEPAVGTPGFSGRVGEALAGFRVAGSEPGRRLVLRGRHRFATYALTFEVDGGALRARTEAAFPGRLGRLYRAAVIGSGGHRLVARRLLRQVAAEAMRRGAADPPGAR
jgi:hypothetical protein